MCIAQDRSTTNKPKAVSLHSPAKAMGMSLSSLLLPGSTHKSLAKLLPEGSIIVSGTPGSRARRDSNKEAAAAEAHPDPDCDATHTTVATRESYDDTATTATSISDPGEREDGASFDASALDSLSFDDVPTGGLILLPRTSRCWFGRQPDESASGISGNGAGSAPTTPPRHPHPVIDLHVDCPKPPPAPSTGSGGDWNGEEDMMYVTPKAAGVGGGSFPATPPTPKHCRVVVFFDAESPLPESLMVPEF
jgi:hypothetical protein